MDLDTKTKEDLIEVAKKYEIKTDGRWSEEKLRGVVAERVIPADAVTVVCVCDNVHLGNGEVLRLKDKAKLSLDDAKFLEDRGQVVVV